MVKGYIVELNPDTDKPYTAEVREEIVRCRDCEWFKEGVVAGKFGKLPNQCLRPTYSGERLELYPEPDDFCSWGSRSDG